MMEKVLTKQTVMNGQIIHLNRFEEYISQEVHTHEFLEIQYVMSGKGIHRIGNKDFETKTGDVFFTNYRTAHCFLSADENDKIVVINCVFLPEFLEPAEISYDSFSEIANDLLYNILFSDEIKEVPYIHVRDNDLRMRRIITTMFEEYTEKNDGYINVIFAGLIELIVCMMRQYKLHNHYNQELNNRRQYMHDILLYIEKHYSEVISLKELSKIAFLSPNYLCSIFKEINGNTISEYIQKKRIENACRLLTETNKSFTEIADEIGYKSEGFLRKLFTKEMGMTPGEYRELTGK